MKDIILISAYCPDEKRQIILDNLINSLPKDQFDVLITSHTPIPSYIQNKVNYVFYDQENPLYHDMESSPFYWDQLKSRNGYVYHTKLQNPLHILAILRLKRFGYQIAKMLGYQKLHCLEYDSLILDPQIFINNSYKLNTYDAVIYKNEVLSKDCIHGSFKSINLNQISNELLEYNEPKIKNYFKTTPKRILPEQYAFDLFSKLNVIIEPSQSFKSFIKTSFNSSNESLYQIIPFIKNKKLILYYFNDSINIPLNFTLQLDNNIQNITINPLEWIIKPLGEYKKISYIKVTIQDKIYLELDFNIDNNREIFQKRHFYAETIL